MKTRKERPLIMWTRNDDDVLFWGTVRQERLKDAHGVYRIRFYIPEHRAAYAPSLMDILGNCHTIELHEWREERAELLNETPNLYKRENTVLVLGAPDSFSMDGSIPSGGAGVEIVFYASHKGNSE